MSLSRFLKIPDVAFSPWLLHREVGLYVIEEFQSQVENLKYPEDGDAEKVVQFLMDYFGHKFRMYGSARELMENVKIFTSLPQSLQFSNCFNVPYTTPPTIFYSMKNEKFIAKSDIFVIIQNMMIGDSDSRDLLLSVAMYLQSQEEKMSDRVEFTRFDEKVLEEIEKEIKLVMADKKLLAQQNYQRVQSRCVSFEDSMEVMKAQHPKIANMLKDPEMFQQLRQLYDKETAGELPSNIAMVAENMGLFIEAMGQVIQKRPEMFLPYSATNKNYSNHPITVRVFEDGDQRFVLKVELSNALYLKGVISVPLSQNCKFHTMSMEQVLKNFDTKNIEFIRYPINRAKHRMVPVKIFNSPAAHFTVLAVDGLFEFLREAIFSLKMFQGPNSAPDLLLETTSIFESHQKFPYFLSIGGLNGIMSIWKELLGDVPTIGVRNAKKDGFTLQNLKNELAHLGLLETFPEIQKHADVVYSEVVKKKKEEFLRTCDLFDAVEHCQLNCIFEKFDFLKTFLHNQNGCHRVYGYKCEECDKIQKTCPVASEVKKASEVSTSTSESKNPESQKTSDALKNSESKNPTQKTSQAPLVTKNVPEDSTTSSKSEVYRTSSSEVTKSPQSNISTQKTSNNAPDAEKQKTSNLKTQESKIPAEKISNPAPDSKTSSESQNQKTSSNCEKCHRVCEMLNETKKELKSTENKLKNLEKKERKIDELEKNKMENLEKKLLAKEREFEEFKKIQKEKLDEKEAENQGLKGKILEKNEENQNLSGQISTLKISISQLKTENSRQEESQKVLEEKNSKLEKELEEEKMKTLEIQKSSQKTSSELESEIQEKNQKLEEFKESEIRMKAENEVNQKMIQQLLDKLGWGGANYSTPSTSSGFWRDSESTSSGSRQKCEICWNSTENHQSVKCQKCRRPFHSQCASNWLKSYKMCPSCDGEFQ